VNRREFVAAAVAGLPLLGASAGSRIGRSRISAISDEVANSPADAIAFAKQYGLEWLELRNEPGSKRSYFYMDDADLKPAARAFADAGIRISFMNTSLLKFGLPGTEPLSRAKETPEKRTVRLEREQHEFDIRESNLRKCIRASKTLGTDRLRVFTFHRVADPKALYPRIAEVLTPLCDIAEREGVKLLVENEASCNVGTCADAAAFLDVLSHAAFGMNWDSLNGTSLGEKPFPDGYALLPKKRIWNVQIKGKSLLEPSQRLDWPDIFRTLERDGYAGELGLETHYFDGTNLEKSHASMREILKIAEAH
jgi:sugar phosphate isomerase/epimerase